MPVRRVALIVTCVASLGVTGAAQAQQRQPSSYSDDGKVSFQSGILPKKPKAGPPDVPAPPMAWPRLDAGAVLCRTEADLDRLAARHSGEEDDGPVDCQVIRNMTAITILQRRGPGKAEVKTTSGQVGTVGWTNAFLPEKAPAATRTSAAR